MKVFFLFTIFLSSVSVFSQDLSIKAQTNPLDLAFYMVKSYDSPEDYSDELREIALGYFRSGRKADALAVIDLMQDKDTKTGTLKTITHWLIRDKKFKEAEFYLSKASETNRKNVYGIDIEDSQELASKWILLNNEQRALDETDFYKNEVVKASILNSIAETYIKNGDLKKASQFLLQAFKLLENAELDEFDTFTKAQIAKSFSEIKNQTKAQKIISEVEENYPKVEYSKSYPKEKIIKELIIETYLKLGEHEKAFKLIEKDFDSQTPEGLIKLAETNIRIGEIVKAKDLLQKVSAFDDRYFEKVQAVRLYLQIDEDVFALELAESFDDDSTKFNSLMTVADKFVNKGKIPEAISVLQNILDISFIDDKQSVFYDESFSDKEEQLAFVFDKYNEIKRPDLALQIIEKANGTDIKTLMFVTFAYLYKSKLSQKTAVDYLNQAQIILLKSKRKTTDKVLLQMWLRLAVEFADFDKEKSLEIFSYVLEKLLSDGNIGESEQIRILTQIGSDFSETKIPGNKRMKTVLRNIKEKWLKEYLQ